MKKAIKGVGGWARHNKGWILIIVLFFVALATGNGGVAYLDGVLLCLYGFYRLYKRAQRKHKTDTPKEPN